MGAEGETLGEGVMVERKGGVGTLCEVAEEDEGSSRLGVELGRPDGGLLSPRFLSIPDL